MRSLEVAVSCLNDDVFTVLERLRDYANQGWLSDEICFHVVHQVSAKEKYVSVTHDFSGLPLVVRYSRLEELGLPISRNYALRECKAKYLVPTDSDVTFFCHCFETFFKQIECIEKMDFYTLESYKDSAGKIPRRAFSESSFVHSRRSLLSVSSIEIIINVERFHEKNVFWDKDFGLGAKFAGGLETVMLQDACRLGLKGAFLPIPLCYHEEESSGAEVSYRRVSIRTAVFARIFGVFLGACASVYFHILSNRRFLKKEGVFACCSAMFSGLVSYWKYKHSKERG